MRRVAAVLGFFLMVQSLPGQVYPSDAVRGRSQLTTAGRAVVVSAAGKVTESSAVAVWKKYTVAYTNAAFKAAATAVSVVLYELPVNGVIQGIRIKHSVAYAGTAVTAVTCSLGDGTDHTAYAPAFGVFQAVSATAQQWDGGAFSTTAAAHNVTLRCTANTDFGDGNDTVLTAGSVDVHVLWAVLP